MRVSRRALVVGAALLLFLFALLLRRTGTKTLSPAPSMLLPRSPAMSSGCPVCVADVVSARRCFKTALASDCSPAFDGVPTLNIGSMKEEDRVAVKRSAADVPISFVTAPRSFDRDTSVRQRAAILSWHMQPTRAKEVVLFGDEDGIGEFAAEWGLKHVRRMKKGADGIPLMDDLFRQASLVAEHGVVCFINSDISLPPEWWNAIQQVLPTVLASNKPFLIAGPRLVLPQGVIWHPTQEAWSSFHAAWIAPKKYSMPVIDGAIDWFVFRRGSYDNFPPFKLGRYVWDSYMVDVATRNDWNTVTTFSYDVGDQVAYGLHWEHSRAHQADKQKPQGDRDANWAIARAHGGLREFGRLRGMELALTRCEGGAYCLQRRFDHEVLSAKLPPRSAPIA